MNKKSKIKKTNKKIFFTFLDAIILVCFTLAVYFSLVKDYVQTTIFLAMGTLLLIFFIVRGVARQYFVMPSFVK